jgi:hypothetical protein
MNPTIAEASDAYLSAQKARRGGSLAVLEQLLTGACGEVPLGVMDIPLKKIRGTYAAGRSYAFSANFMPLLSEDSEFAAKWRMLYGSVLAKGVTEPIKVYEYLGWYYVLEGHKRVGVASALSNYSLPANATRLMPPAGEDSPELAVFLEILGGDKKKVIRHMWFSSPGRYAELLELSGRDDALLEETFMVFRAAYHKRGYDQSLPGITTGDAFWQYVKLYGLPSGAGDPGLTKNMINCLPQWELLAHPKDVKIVSDPAETGHKHLFHIQRGALPTVTFAYREPRNCLSAEAHEAGRYALRRAFPEIVAAAAGGLPDGIKTDILFVTDPALSDAALRLTLEKRSKLTMLCHDNSPGNMGTYCADTGEMAYLLGVLAGCLSASGRVAFHARITDGPETDPVPVPEGGNSELQAFAQGASAVRPSARTYTGGLKSMGEQGVDMVVLPRVSFENHPAAKAFPGVYARLCSLSQSGSVVETLGAAAWHWEAFYVKFIRSVIENGLPGDRPHYRMGLDSGVLDLHLTLHASGAKNCLSAFRQALTGGLLAPDGDNAIEIISL